ncbi:C2H2 finger domain-containing protein [Apiospora arundinis]
MSSIYTVSPASLHDHRGSPRDRMNVPHHSPPQNAIYHQSLYPVDSQQQLLSPHSSHLQSNSASPTGASNTPAESISTSTTYQPSDFSSENGDPFFGANFNVIEGLAPTFLDDQLVHLNSTENPGHTGYHPSLSLGTQVTDFGIKPAGHHSQPEISSNWAEDQYSQTAFSQFNSEEPPPRDSTSFDHSSSAPSLHRTLTAGIGPATIVSRRNAPTWLHIVPESPCHYGARMANSLCMLSSAHSVTRPLLLMQRIKLPV